MPAIITNCVLKNSCCISLRERNIMKDVNHHSFVHMQTLSTEIIQINETKQKHLIGYLGMELHV